MKGLECSARTTDPEREETLHGRIFYRKLVEHTCGVYRRKVIHLEQSVKYRRQRRQRGPGETAELLNRGIQESAVPHQPGFAPVGFGDPKHPRNKGAVVCWGPQGPLRS